MKKRKLFGNEISPSCKYCAYSTATQTPETLHCSRRNKDYNEAFSCSAFRYDPLKRKPNVLPPLPQFDAGDFEL